MIAVLVNGTVVLIPLHQHGATVIPCPHEHGTNLPNQHRLDHWIEVRKPVEWGWRRIVLRWVGPRQRGQRRLDRRHRHGSARSATRRLHLPHGGHRARWGTVAGARAKRRPSGHRDSLRGHGRYHGDLLTWGWGETADLHHGVVQRLLQDLHG